jgi:glucosamine--fructose-6-phosphate aminotransferase (isomerizing)
MMETEIREEPQKIRDAYRQNHLLVQAIALQVHARNIRKIILSARGSSDNSGTYFKYLCEVVAGIVVSFASPSVLTLYDGKLNLSDALVLGISQSGQAEDVLAVLAAAKSQGSLTVSITNAAQSPMAKAADFHLDLVAGYERSVAATKSFTSQMYVLAMLVAALSGDQTLTDQLQKVAGYLEDLFKLQDQISLAAEEWKNTQTCFVLGRGFNYAIAHELALKLQETTYIKALGFATSDFHHGPFALIDETAQVILLAPSDPTMLSSLAMIEKLQMAHATILALTDDPSLPVHQRILLPQVHAYISPFLYILAGQMFACALSLKRGLNPDSPRGLKKVTITK